MQRGCHPPALLHPMREHRAPGGLCAAWAGHVDHPSFRRTAGRHAPVAESMIYSECMLLASLWRKPRRICADQLPCMRFLTFPATPVAYQARRGITLWTQCPHSMLCPCRVTLKCEDEIPRALLMLRAARPGCLQMSPFASAMLVLGYQTGAVQSQRVLSALRTRWRGIPGCHPQSCFCLLLLFSGLHRPSQLAVTFDALMPRSWHAYRRERDDGGKVESGVC